MVENLGLDRQDEHIAAIGKIVGLDHGLHPELALEGLHGRGQGIVDEDVLGGGGTGGDQGAHQGGSHVAAAQYPDVLEINHSWSPGILCWSWCP